VSKYLESLKDEDVLKQIRILTNAIEILDAYDKVGDRLQGFKDEADKRGLDYSDELKQTTQ
jgi:hypothetical protein